MSWSHPAHDAIIHLLGERTGLSFPPQRHESTEQGIQRAMARTQARDLAQYRLLIDSDPAALDDLISELTIGETYFFREPAQFEFIRREVLPDLMRRWGVEHGIRAWCAGCASGEEAYSLAIVLAEAGLAGQSHLLASDISRNALMKAHRAEFGKWSLRGDGVASASPYLSQRGNLFTLHQSIRRLVTFEYLNLALDVYPSFASGVWGMDLILCRNVLIYFDREAVRKVARRLFETLAPGGWLLTASSDPPLGDDAPYATVVTDAGVFYRRAGGEEGLAARRSLQSGARDELVVSHDAESSERIAWRPNALRTEDSASRLTRTDKPYAEALEAFARGEYRLAAELTHHLKTDVAAAVLHVRALSNLDPTGAEQACAEAVQRHPLSAELRYLHAVLLLECGHVEEAAQAARQVIYLDRSLALGHFMLGSIQRRRGYLAAARRSYRNARDLCAARPAEEIVPLSESEQAGRLAQAAAAQLALLDAALETTS
jgi:chemotaxis protein methyltransferase CheR